MGSLFSEEWSGALVIPFVLGGAFLWIVLKCYFGNRKIKKLKYGGTGVLKKTKVSVVGKRYIDGDRDSSGYYVYRLETKDEDGNSYKSEVLGNVEYGGYTVEEMKKKCGGVTYDLSDKDNAIKQLNDDVNRLGAELQNNPGFFKKCRLERDIATLKKYIDIAKGGPKTPYLIYHGHKVSVGDSIDVFVNPDKPTEYYFDLDFTKEN